MNTNPKAEHINKCTATESTTTKGEKKTNESNKVKKNTQKKEKYNRFDKTRSEIVPKTKATIQIYCAEF